MNPYTLNFNQYKPVILEALIEVYGSEFSSLITKRYNNICYVPYVNHQGIHDYYRFLIKCKSKELSLKFLQIVGIDTSKYNITSYADPLPDELLEKVRGLLGGDYTFEPLYRDAPDTFKAFIPKFKEDYTSDFILENKLKFINEIKRVGTPTITEENLEEFSTTDEYKRIESMAFFCHGIYSALNNQMDDFVESIKEYEDYYQKEVQRKRKILDAKKLELYKVLERHLDGKIKRHIDSIDRIEHKANDLLSATLDQPSNIEYFNDNYESMLQDPDKDQFTKDTIKRMRMKYFKTMGANINPWNDNYEEVIKRKAVKQLIVNARFANEVTRLRKHYLEEAEKEFIYSSDEFNRIMQSFKQDDYNREYLYDILSKIQVCTNVGSNKNCDFNSIVYYTIRDWQCGCMDFVTLHEIIHAIETVQQKNKDHSCGFEMNVGESELSPYNHKMPKRKYERLNETITDILSIEVTNILHRRGIYFLDDKLTTLSDVSNFNTRKVVKDAVQKFYNKFRYHIIEARIYGDITYLTDRIGKDNFEEFNRIIDQLDYLTEQGLEDRLEKNDPIDDMVIMYHHILEQLDELHNKMSEVYHSGDDPYNPFGFIRSGDNPFGFMKRKRGK